MSTTSPPAATPPVVPAPPAAPHVKRSVNWMHYARQHRGWVVVEVALLLLALALDVLVARHPAPLPGDVGATLALQRLLLPHQTLTWLINQTSELTWPLAATLTTIAIIGLFLLMRRWLDALLLALIPALGSGASYLTTLIIQRPRPIGFGIHVQMMVKGFYSFPSGHVEHALVFFGLLLFLTYHAHWPAWWVWPLRLLLVAIIVLIGPSRMLEGEHWLSDVVAGYLYGAFWLILGLQVYGWAAQRWPRLLAPGERRITVPPARPLGDEGESIKGLQVKPLTVHSSAEEGAAP